MINSERPRWRKHMLFAGTAGVAFAATPLAEAQEAQVAEPDGEAATRNVVIVTANRHEESVQDVAQSISALSGDALLEHGIGDYEGFCRVNSSRFYWPFRACIDHATAFVQTESARERKIRNVRLLIMCR